MSYDTVLFDMDGTVLDTLHDLWASTNAVLRELGAPERTLDEIRSYVGNGAANQIRRAMPEGSSDAALSSFTARSGLLDTTARRFPAAESRSSAGTIPS